jgi:hypothetical protein
MPRSSALRPVAIAALTKERTALSLTASGLGFSGNKA